LNGQSSLGAKGIRQPIQFGVEGVALRLGQRSAAETYSVKQFDYTARQFRQSGQAGPPLKELTRRLAELARRLRGGRP